MNMDIYSLETSRDNHMFGFNPSLLACLEEKYSSRNSWRLLSIKKLQAVYCQQCPSTFPMPSGKGITSGCSEVLYVQEDTYLPVPSQQSQRKCIMYDNGQTSKN